MNPLTLDHVGLIVRDLALARDVMHGLGFALTARADHSMTTADGRTVSAGSSQHAIMLAHGYIELMQITDPRAGHQLAAAPQERFGLHILALGTTDAEASHATYAAQGQVVGPIRRWAREVDEADRKGLARFVYFEAPWSAGDPSYLCWVHHLTPELMRSSSCPHHPNSARSVRAVHYGGPAESLQGWEDRLRGLGIAGRRAQGQTMLDLGPSVLQLHTAAELPRVLPRVLEVGFASLDELRQRCLEMGIGCLGADASGACDVDLSGSLGIQLRCVAEARRR